MAGYFSSFNGACLECRRLKRKDEIWTACENCILLATYCPDCMITHEETLYCPKCVIQCRKCNRTTISFERPICDGCKRPTIYCPDCLTQHDGKLYCPECVMKCENCDRLTTDNRIPLCKQCIHYSVREVMECLSPDSPYKSKLPFVDRNYKLKLDKPLLERSLIAISRHTSHGPSKKWRTKHMSCEHRSVYMIVYTRSGSGLRN